jgi:hypothetical protein
MYAPVQIVPGVNGAFKKHAPNTHPMCPDRITGVFLAKLPVSQHRSVCHRFRYSVYHGTYDDNDDNEGDDDKEGDDPVPCPPDAHTPCRTARRL